MKCGTSNTIALGYKFISIYIISVYSIYCRISSICEIQVLRINMEKINKCQGQYRI
jgi:hypothetical protein